MPVTAPATAPAHDEPRVPVRPTVRSLNLANTVCLAAYTAAVRSGHPLPDNDGAYEPPVGGGTNKEQK